MIELGSNLGSWRYDAQSLVIAHTVAKNTHICVHSYP